MQLLPLCDTGIKTVHFAVVIQFAVYIMIAIAPNEMFAKEIQAECWYVLLDLKNDTTSYRCTNKCVIGMQFVSVHMMGTKYFYIKVYSWNEE